MPDPFDYVSAGLEAPARGAYAVTLADAPVAQVCRGFRVGTGGGLALKITLENGDIVTIPNVQDAEFFPYAVRQFWATGSGAVSGIVAVY